MLAYRLVDHIWPPKPSQTFGFALLAALILHSALLSLGFGFSRAAPPPPSLDVTLVKHQSTSPPLHAETLAQHHQQGSGNEASLSQLATPLPAPIADIQANPAGAQPRPKQVLEPSHPTASLTAHRQGDASPEEPREDSRAPASESAAILPPGDEIASLQARLQQAQMQYSRLPRTLRTTALSAQAASHAEYLAAWVERVEAVGNRHYPSEARQRKLFGELQLAVTLLPDGSIAGIDILRSSGHPLLDYAARDTLLRAAPFAPFPAEMTARWDRFEIIRTWQFIPGNHLNTLP